MNPLQSLKGVGPNRIKQFEKLGILSRRDLLLHFPRRYQDRRVIVNLSEAVLDNWVCVRAKVDFPLKMTRFGTNKTVYTTKISDGTERCGVSFFNMPYIENMLRLGGEYIFFGKLTKSKYGLEMQNPLFEAEGVHKVTGRIVPIYPLTAGISSAFIENCLSQIINSELQHVAETLPEHVRAANTLCHLDFAYRQIHTPDDEATLAIARRRLVFEELLLLALGLAKLRRRTNGDDFCRCSQPTLCGKPHGGICMPQGELSAFVNNLPFTPTNDQLSAINGAISDMRSGNPMHRLLQGDVGSGKTAVAAALAYITTANGYQTALMAPTEILAIQHAESLTALLPDCRIVLCTGRLKAAERRHVESLIASGEADVIVGTQALLSGSVQFAKLGLVVADEQHRFGVTQRMNLTNKDNQAETPHTLVMSATPIPRTLGLILYGDLDVSVIKQMPAERKPIMTHLVPERKRADMAAFIRKQVSEGRQAYVVCPRVEIDEFGEGKKSVQQMAKELQDKTFPDLRVGLLHGKSKDKDTVMAAFATGQLDILVATTVIEVGVNVPNATVMVIEDADSFGLAQLHQLRGRVGRGAVQSYCFFMGNSENERLQLLTQTTDGFELAEHDLRLRGPGSFFGAEQSGFGALKMQNVGILDNTNDASCPPAESQAELFAQARNAAQAILAEDPELSAQENRPLKQAVEGLIAHL